jgi:hypothetical protein
MISFVRRYFVVAVVANIFYRKRLARRQLILKFFNELITSCLPLAIIPSRPAYPLFLSAFYLWSDLALRLLSLLSFQRRASFSALHAHG